MRRLANLAVRWPLAVIAFWVALAVALPLTLPNLNDMSQKHPLAMLPGNAPSTVAARDMTKGFSETGTDDLMLVVLSDPRGLGPEQERTYRNLVSALREDSDDVVMLQDFIETPSLRSFVTSKDGKAWVVPVGLAGALGTPQSFGSFNRVSDIVREQTAGSSLEVHVTGPAATVADLTVAGERDRRPIEIAIAVLLLLVLLIVYRNPITMVIPLIGIGMSLVIAQSAVAGLSEATGFGVSNQAIILLSAIIAGAGTDYAVFLISRYHDYVRRGDTSDDAVRHALSSVGKVITASAATIGITFLAISFAKMGVFSTVGVSSAIGVAVAFLAAITLLPAIIAVVGRWGWIKPRRELSARFWRRSGIRIVRRPWTHLVASLLVLAALAGAAGLARYNYDDRKSVQRSDPSAVGYAALERHFDISQFVPSYVLIYSPRNLRTPQTLADMEQMADRISQLPDIAMVNGVTRPLGKVPKEFRATYQAGIVGDKLNDGSATIGENMEGLNRLSAGANDLAGGLTDVRVEVNDLATNIQGMVEAFSALKFEYSGDSLVKNVELAAKLVQAVNELGTSMGVTYQAGRDLLGWVGPVLAALQGNVVCDFNPSCAETRGHFQNLVDARNTGKIDKINDLATQLKDLQKTQSLSSTLNQIKDSYIKLSAVMKAMGLDTPAGAQSTMNQFRQQADRAADGSQQVAAGVDQVIGQIETMRAGLDQAAAFLRSMREDAVGPTMAGFNIPPEVLGTADFRAASKTFISPDGHWARYLVFTKLDPFSPAAMDQVNAILETARSAQPNTSLQGATISIGGFPAALRDTRDYYRDDIRFIVLATILIVLTTLVLLLRAIVAPLYLVGSVVISYFGALGIGVLVFQYGLHQPLHWTVAPLAFVILVAVGADYNLLFASRLRDESPNSTRYGVIRTLSSTGGVITAAGLIFAASMWGLLFSSIGTVVQGGFVIGAGILLDTFVVRTVLVPAIATLMGRANWWPSRLTWQGRA